MAGTRVTTRLSAAGLIRGAAARVVHVMTSLALEVLRAPLAEVSRRVDESIAELSAYGSSASWRGAVEATLAISRGPKHLIRPQLVLLGGLGGGATLDDPRLTRFAVGVELLHLFMLIHDDVMDNATRRRGHPTLQVALRARDAAIPLAVARDLAIVMGNMLNVAAMRHLMPDGAGGATAACTLVLDACCHAGAGQFQDLLGWRRLGDDEAALRRALVDKTAYQTFASPLAAGLSLVQGDSDVQPAIAWGCRMGLAFQVLDDLADLVSPPNATGKDALRNLMEGHPSVPLLVLDQRARGEDVDVLESVVGRGSMVPAERMAIARMVDQYQVVDACADYARREIAGCEAVVEGAFEGEAREGLRSMARGLEAHLEAVVADARARRGR